MKDTYIPNCYDKVKVMLKDQMLYKGKCLLLLFLAVLAIYELMRWPVVRRTSVRRLSVGNLQNLLLLKNQQWDFDETSQEGSLHGSF